jgi:S1-C subfamily serine protease
MTVTPPPHEPVHPTAPTPTPPPAPAAHRWRWIAAGATAGAVLAVSVAIPVTWAARNGAPFAVAEQQQQTGIDDEQQADRLPWTREPAVLVPSDLSGADATDDQATGVVLVNTAVPGGEGAGTGLVLSDDGLVLTNYHVVDGASEITATVATTGETYTGQVVGYDDVADVALVQLEEATGLDEARLDDDGDDDEVGDQVTAVGNARGQGSLSAVSGTVTATEQEITTSEPDAESLAGLLETDAAAVPGYSGGPTLDDEGEVIGVTTAASSTGASESYAVPIDDALAVVDRIEAGDESGTVHVGPPAYLGVTVTQGTGTGGNGVPIADVAAGSPAADAGIAAGDRVTAVGGTAVSTVDDLLAALGEHEPGDHVDLTWTRDGTEHTATVTLDESPYA